MPELIIELNLGPGQVLQYYRGVAQVVQARATTGQLVQFPASVLQRHVTKDGIRGRFRLEFDANHKLVGLHPVDASPG
ncbi:MAG TPA: DUF2835 domain-containing protein [Opitutaceae bacterium]|nr:DUF2835 domain-containing protein [Opitutaceae bacterium]